MTTGKKSPDTIKKELSYIEKVWQTVAIVALLVVCILIARVAFNVLLMALAGSLIAVYFHGLGDLIQRENKAKAQVCHDHFRCRYVYCIWLIVWFIGAKIQSQVTQLNNNTSAHIFIRQKLNFPNPLWGKSFLILLPGTIRKNWRPRSQTFFSTSFGVLGDLYIILFLGIFFTASPCFIKTGY